MVDMMYNLFYRHVPVSDINGMTYFEMKFWNECHKMMEKAEVKAAPPLQG